MIVEQINVKCYLLNRVMWIFVFVGLLTSHIGHALANNCLGDGPEHVQLNVAPLNMVTIADLQGTTRSSPYTQPWLKKYRSKQSFSILGIVTLVRHGKDPGFYMQQSGNVTASAPLRSRGIFVLLSAQYHGVLKRLVAGHRVCVSGQVEEHYGMTRIIASTIKVVSRGDPIAPVNLDVSVTDQDFRQTLERYEGMLVRLLAATDLRVTKPHFFNRRYRQQQIILSYKNINLHPNSAAFAGSINADDRASANKLGRLYLQQVNNMPMLDKRYFTHPEQVYMRVNDRLQGVEGVLNFSYGEFRLLLTKPIQPVNVLHLSDRQAISNIAKRHASDLRIASFNLNNYFTTAVGGDKNPLGVNRGAPSVRQLLHQEAKLVTAIVGLDADFIGLMEVENNGYGHDSAIARLARLVNQRWSDVTKQYRLVQPSASDLAALGYQGQGAITVAALYRPSRLTLVNTDVIPLPVQRIDGLQVSHRYALTPTFLRHQGHNSGGKLDTRALSLTISVNHFKSKGTRCWEDLSHSIVADAGNNKMAGTAMVNRDLRQGNCAAFRVQAARVLGQKMRSYPHDKVILGDLNSYAKEDALLLLTDYQAPRYSYYAINASQHTFVDDVLLSTEVGKGFGYINPFAKAQLSSWTYSFNELGSLDYILLSSALADVVRQQQVWHINAAESDIAIATTGPYRSSDHDPLFVDLVR